MTCEHLIALEKELIRKEIKETYRGQAWSDNCREWVYFDSYLDTESIRKRLMLDDCVENHEHLGTHDGQESGFVCKMHNDAIMGVHKKFSQNKKSD